MKSEHEELFVEAAAECCATIVGVVDHTGLHMPIPWTDAFREELRTEILGDFYMVLKRDGPAMPDGWYEQLCVVVEAACDDRIAELHQMPAGGVA